MYCIYGLLVGGETRERVCRRVSEEDRVNLQIHVLGNDCVIHIPSLLYGLTVKKYSAHIANVTNATTAITYETYSADKPALSGNKRPQIGEKASLNVANA